MIENFLSSLGNITVNIKNFFLLNLLITYNFFLEFPISQFCLPTILFILNWPSGFPGDSVAKNLPTMQETQVWSLGWKDPLEKEMTTHSSILA